MTNPKDEIRTALKGVGLAKVNDEILGKCSALLKTHNVSPQQLAEVWEAFSLNKNTTSLDEHSFAPFRQQVIKISDVEMTDALGAVQVKRDVPATMITPAAKRHQQPDQQRPLKQQQLVDHAGGGGGSPHKRVSLSPDPPLAHQPKLETSSSIPAFSERANAGKVVATFNPNNLAPIELSAASTPRCVISYDEFETNVSEPYRHMFTVMDERARKLDEWIVEKEAEFMERYHFGESDVAALEAVAVPRQEKICCIGRICNAAHEGRINATSVLLEGSRNMSGGARVEVDLSVLKQEKQSYSLFPGQIVAVEGLNSSGRKLVAHRICEGAAMAPVESTVGELMKYHHDDSFQGGSPVQILTASGPFTCSDNLDYEPLLDLLNMVKQTKPDVVILTGPFVDMEHKSHKAGQATLVFVSENGDKEEVMVSYEVYFANQVAVLLEQLYEEDDSIQTQFVLVPSLEDATAEWVYPQAPFTDRCPGGSFLNIPGADGIQVGTLGLDRIETLGRDGGPRRVHCVSNPCTLKINEVVVGVTATDALFHISTDETSANLEPGSRLGRIAQHMLQQRSYYPLFPAAGKTNLDLKRMDQWKMPCAPDLLILPSKLTPFARSILDNSTVVVNPGHLTRDRIGGTYAAMDIHPIARETLENAGGDDVALKHNLHDRTRVEIKRI